LIALSIAIVALLSTMVDYERVAGQWQEYDLTLKPGEYWASPLNMAILRPGGGLGLRLELKILARGGGASIMVFNSTGFERWANKSYSEPLASIRVEGPGNHSIDTRADAIYKGLYIVVVNEGSEPIDISLSVRASWLERVYTIKILGDMAPALFSAVIILIVLAAWFKARAWTPFT